jgi:hypothetical protein
MKSLLRKTALAAISGALAFGTVSTATAAAADAPEAKAITCESSSSGKDASFYNGESASKIYDQRFSSGPAVPGLGKSTPQGVAAWENWDGKGNGLLLVTSYGKSGEAAHIIGIDPKTGKHIGTVDIAESHVGGIAVAKGWAFVQGDTNTIRKYRLSDLAGEMKKSGTLKEVGEPRKVYAASFLSSYGDKLYAGKFNAKGRDKMYAYKVNSDGSLETQPTAYEVPAKTQGLLVTKDHFIYSTSYGRTNRSNIYLVDGGAQDLDQASTRCFRAPSMAEGIAAYDGSAYVVYESGSYKYQSEQTRNVIQNLHKSKLSTLTSAF